MDNIKKYRPEEASQAEDPDISSEGLANAYDDAIHLLTTAKADKNADASQVLHQAFFLLLNYFKENNYNITGIKDAENNLETLEPFVYAELEKLSRDPSFSELTIDDLLSDTDPEGNPKKSIWSTILENAKEQQKEALKLLPNVQYKNGHEIKTVTDKLANVFFSLNAPISKMDINGQYKMIPLKYEGNKSKKEVTLLYAPVFDEATLTTLGLKHKFDSYDFFVMSTLDNLKYEGNEVVSLSKIWHEMGNTGSPTEWQLTELYKSVRKGISTTVVINNKEVLEAWGQDISRYKEIVSPAMPVQMLTEKFTANGYTAAGTIRINSYSPFFIVAQPLGHYTAWNKEILQRYTGRRTSRYYTVLRYLMMQIGWMLNDKSKRNNKIALQSLYDYAGDKTSRAKQLTKDMAYRLLDEAFIPTGYIKSYKEDPQDGGICLFWEGQKPINKKKKILPPPSRK